MKILKNTCVTIFRIGLTLVLAQSAFVTSGCSHSAMQENASSKKVLVVTSSETLIMLDDGAVYPTGTFLNEFAVPVKAMIDAGFTPVFASPKGSRITWDNHSIDKKFFNGSDEELKSALSFVSLLGSANETVRLEQILSEGMEDYVGIFIPGGHAPMSDLAKDAHLGKLLHHFHEQEKPTALICHGPVALLSTLRDSESFIEAASSEKTFDEDIQWPYKGYSMTAFSREEEQFAEQNQLGGTMPFYLDQALSRAGAQVEGGNMWESQVVRHKELITGRQPFSDADFSRVLVSALQEYSRRPKAAK